VLGSAVVVTGSMTNNTLDISLRGMPRAQSRAANFVARIGDISVAQCANRRDADPLMWNHVGQDAEGAAAGHVPVLYLDCRGVMPWFGEQALGGDVLRGCQMGMEKTLKAVDLSKKRKAVKSNVH
jgi:hypothetical protein